jgi:formamidopyrimidine-DNA glycosylase
MPELPEIEITLRKIKFLIGAEISGFLSFNNSLITNTDVADVKIIDIFRSGKKIYLYLDNSKHIQISFGMTGYLHISKEIKRNPHLVLYFVIKHKDEVLFLSFIDERRFGSILISTQFEILDEIYSTNGRKIFINKFLTSKAKVYSLLIDQNNAPGVGSYLAQESLWLSNIHPLAVNLPISRINVLYSNLCKIIKKSIKYNGATWDRFTYPDGSVGNFFDKLEVYGESNVKCSKCNNTYSFKKINSRNIKYCIVCQIF